MLGRPHIFGQLHGCPAELNIRMIMMPSKASSPPDIIALINLPALCRYKVVLLGEHGAEDSLSTIERSLTQLYLQVINVWPLQLCNYTPENNPFFWRFFFIMQKANIKPQNNRHKGREPWGCESKRPGNDVKMGAEARPALPK